MSSPRFEPSLVPELLVSDLGESLDFWCELCGFVVDYQRPEERFAYISLDSAHVMLEQTGVGRNWVAGDLEMPFGRGLNLQVTVSDVRDIEDSLDEACYPLFMPTESRWYRISDNEEAGVRQFVVADPDGYLVRFQESLGHRRTAPAADDEKGNA